MCRKSIVVHLLTAVALFACGCVSKPPTEERVVFGCGTASRALRDLGIEKGCQAVISALDDEEDEEMRSDFVFGVVYFYYHRQRGMGSKHCALVVKRALSDASPRVRQKGVRLAKVALPIPEAVRLLTQVSKESDKETRRHAMAAILVLKNDPSWEPDWGIRKAWNEKDAADKPQTE